MKKAPIPDKYKEMTAFLTRFGVSPTDIDPVAMSKGAALLHKMRLERLEDEKLQPFGPPRLSEAEFAAAEERERLAVEAYKEWLPPLLTAWSVELKRLRGIDEATFKSLPTYAVLKWLRDGKLATIDDAHSPINAVCETMNWFLYEVKLQMGEDIDDGDKDKSGLVEVLAVHYLSGEPARLKAKYFGISTRVYWRQVDAAHRLVAPDIHAEIERLRPKHAGTLQTPIK
jgi:hypothetical protein